MINGIKVIDCHVHYAYPIKPDEIISNIKESNADSANLVLVPDRMRVSALPEALMVKDISNNNFYVFSNLDVSCYFKNKFNLGSAFKRYTKRILKAGVDGIKIIEGKPSMRRVLPIPDFDSKVWIPFFKYAEKKRLPILMHLNDPKEFWDKDKIPSFAKKSNWGYDESDVSYTSQYNQMENVLSRYPKLNITFAHFYFMSDNLEKLSSLLDKFENMHIDLTPGIEMYDNLSKDIDKTKEFFIKYQDRIMYGTDIAARNVIGFNKKINKNESNRRSNIIQTFLSTDKVLDIDKDDDYLIDIIKFQMKSINLDKEIQEKIYNKNFTNFVLNHNIVNKHRAIKEAKKVKNTIRLMSLFDKKLKVDFKTQNEVIKYFKGR